LIRRIPNSIVDEQDQATESIFPSKLRVDAFGITEVFAEKYPKLTREYADSE
jgi:hypothetical protein